MSQLRKYDELCLKEIDGFTEEILDYDELRELYKDTKRDYLKALNVMDGLNRIIQRLDEENAELRQTLDVYGITH